MASSAVAKPQKATNTTSAQSSRAGDRRDTRDSDRRIEHIDARHEGEEVLYRPDKDGDEDAEHDARPPYPARRSCAPEMRNIRITEPCVSPHRAQNGDIAALVLHQHDHGRK